MDLSAHLRGGELVGAQEASRCSSNLATRRSPLQGNPGEHTAHWAALKIHPRGFHVTPEVKIHPAGSCWLVSPTPLCSLHLVLLGEERGGEEVGWLSSSFSLAPLPPGPWQPPPRAPRQQSPEEAGPFVAAGNCQMAVAGLGTSEE